MMKKLLISSVVAIAFVVSLGLSSSYAIPIQLHVDAYGNQENAGWTSVFDQMGFFANTTTTQYGTIDPVYGAPRKGSKFTDMGNLNIDAFKGMGVVYLYSRPHLFEDIKGGGNYCEYQ